MSDLRKKLIRLAYDKPNLRKDVLRLVKASEVTAKDARKALQKMTNAVISRGVKDIMGRAPMSKSYKLVVEGLPSPFIRGFISGPSAIYPHVVVYLWGPSSSWSARWSPRTSKVGKTSRSGDGLTVTEAAAHRGIKTVDLGVSSRPKKKLDIDAVAAANNWNRVQTRPPAFASEKGLSVLQAVPVRGGYFIESASTGAAIGAGANLLTSDGGGRLFKTLDEVEEKMARFMRNNPGNPSEKIVVEEVSMPQTPSVKRDPFSGPPRSTGSERWLKFVPKKWHNVVREKALESGFSEEEIADMAATMKWDRRLTWAKSLDRVVGVLERIQERKRQRSKISSRKRG